MVTSTGPSDGIRTTLSPRLTWAPADGSVAMISPGGMLLCRALPGTAIRPAFDSSALAARSLSRTTDGMLKYWPAASHQTSTASITTAMTIRMRRLNNQRCSHGSRLRRDEPRPCEGRPAAGKSCSRPPVGTIMVRLAPSAWLPAPGLLSAGPLPLPPLAALPAPPGNAAPLEPALLRTSADVPGIGPVAAGLPGRAAVACHE